MNDSCGRPTTASRLSQDAFRPSNGLLDTKPVQINRDGSAIILDPWYAHQLAPSSTMLDCPNSFARPCINSGDGSTTNERLRRRTERASPSAFTSK